MSVSLKVVIVVYVIVMMGCIASFFIQQFIVYDEHIRPGREGRRLPIRVEIKDTKSTEIREADIIFINDSIMTNPSRMGNEIEEHLLSLLVANLATGILLLIVVITGNRKAINKGAGGLNKTNNSADI